jgi:aspartyl-tRNA(Asn)/glutamyl-tRNA(Gln) amidotransferase subunit A
MPSSTAAEMVHHTQMEGLGEVVRKRINVGKYFLSQEGREQYDNANEVRQRIMSQFEEAFKRFDLILTPTTIGPALSVEEYKALDPLESDAYDTFTCPANMCGLPAISVPFGETQDKKLPLGVQLIANHFQEHKLLQAARVLQHQRKQS